MPTIEDLRKKLDFIERTWCPKCECETFFPIGYLHLCGGVTVSITEKKLSTEKK